MRYFRPLLRLGVMNSMRRAAASLLVPPLLAGCLLMEPIPTPTPRPTPTPLPTVVATPTAVPTPTDAPGPGLADVPRFTAGGQAATNAPGLRVRARPGMEQRVITSLGVDANLLIALGPVWVDDIGWYLVRDADTADPKFGEGWVAAGFEPDPFLISASFEVGRNPYLAGFAHDANGEFGPVFLPDAKVSIRWIAAPFTSDGCNFFVDLRTGSGEPVSAIRATVGGVPAPGELFSQFFAGHRDLIDTDLFVAVTSDCSWALTFVRQLSDRSEPTPAPPAP
jgi:hypothetical protein